MKIALINCSKLKYPVPCPAFLLYARSPRFCMHYNHALERKLTVVIISGKYGLIAPKQVLYPYDLKIIDQKECFKKGLLIKINNLFANSRHQIYSYLSKSYQDFLLPGKNTFKWYQKIFLFLSKELF